MKKRPAKTVGVSRPRFAMGTWPDVALDILLLLYHQVNIALPYVSPRPRSASKKSGS